MKVIEYIAEVLPNGSLALPDDIRKSVGDTNTSQSYIGRWKRLQRLIPRRVGKFSKTLAKTLLLVNCLTPRQSMMNTSTAHGDEHLLKKVATRAPPTLPLASSNPILP